MFSIIAVALLTLAIVCAIFLAAFTRLWKDPPTVHITLADLPSKFQLNLPDLVFPDFPKLPVEFVVKHQHVPAAEETRKPIDEPIPEDILIYIEQESDSWAQEARKRRARMLKAETGNWDAAFRLLQREDNPDV